MGARWLWYARCPNGHTYSNFSGSAEPCCECGMPPEWTLDCPHEMWDGAGDVCDCPERIKIPAASAGCHRLAEIREKELRAERQRVREKALVILDLILDRMTPEMIEREPEKIIEWIVDEFAPYD